MSKNWIVGHYKLHHVCSHEQCDMRCLMHVAHCNGLKYRHSVNHSILTSAIRKTLISYFGIHSKRSNPITDILPASLCDTTNNDSSTIQIKGWDRNKSRKINSDTQVNFSIAKKCLPCFSMSNKPYLESMRIIRAWDTMSNAKLDIIKGLY